MADSQRAAAEIDASNHDMAIGFLVRSLGKNPRDSSVVSALMRLGIEHPPVIAEKMADGNFKDVQVSRNGAVAVLLAADGHVSIRRNATPPQELATKSRQISLIHLDPEGRFLALASGQEIGCLPLTDGVAGEVTWQLLPNPASALAVGLDGTLLAGDMQGAVHLVRPGQRTEILKPESKPGSPIRQVSWRSGESPLPVALADEGVWPSVCAALGQGRQLEVIPGQPMVYTASGIMWTATYDLGKLVGDGPRSQLIAYGHDEAEGWNLVASSPECPRMKITGVTADDAGRTCLALLDSDELFLAGLLPDRHSFLSRPGVSAAIISPDGTVAVTSHFDGSMRRWEGEYLAPLWGISHAPQGVIQLAASADASKVLIRTRDAVWIQHFPKDAARRDPYHTPWVVAADLPPGFREIRQDRKRLRSSNGVRIDREEATEDNEGRWRISGGRRSIRIAHPMAGGESRNRGRLAEVSHVAVCSTTWAAISPNGRRLATSAADQPIRIWDADNGNQLTSIHKGNNGAYPITLALSVDGSKLLARYIHSTVNRSYYQVYRTLDGAPEGNPMTLYSGEELWDVSPDLASVLVGTTESIEVRETLTARVLAGPVSLNSAVWFAGFAAQGESFVMAARDGRFRIWRSDDATPLCGISTFDSTPSNFSGDPDDGYRFSVWEETVGGESPVVRRLAFKIEETGTSETASKGWKMFDMGLSGPINDQEKLARMMSDLYAIELSETGNLVRREPCSADSLKSRYLAPGSWTSLDFERLAMWFIDTRHRGKVSPLSTSEDE